jgi:WD40 repeat protein
MARSLSAFAFLLVACAITAQPPGDPKPLQTFKGHADPVYAVAYGPDGKLVATGSFDKTIKLWDAASGKELRSFAGPQGHQSLVLSIAFSPSGDFLVSGGADNFAKIWDVPSAKPFREVAVGGAGPKVAVATDGKSYAVGGADGKARVFSTADGKQLIELPTGGGAVRGLSFVPNAPTLATIGADRVLRYWNATDGKPIGAIGSGPADATSLIPLGGNLYSSSADGTIRAWPLTATPPKKLVEHSANIVHGTFSADGNVLFASAADKSIRWINTANGQPVVPPVTLPTDATALAIAPNNTAYAVGTSDGKLEVYGNDGKPKGDIVAHAGPTRAVAFHPNGTQLLTAGDDGAIKVHTYPLVTPKTLAHPDAATALAAHVDGKRIITGGKDKIVRVWNNGAAEKSLAGAESAIASVMMVNDLIAAGEGNGTVRLWTASNGQPLAAIPAAHPKPVVAIALAADGQHLATSDATGPVKVWKLPIPPKGMKVEPVATVPLKGPIRALEAVPGQAQFRVSDETGVGAVFDKLTGKPVAPPEAVTGKLTAFARASTKSVLAVSNGTVHNLVVRGSDNKLVKEIALPGQAEALAISASGTRIVAGVVGPKGRTVLAFDADSGRELQTLRTPTVAVNGLAILADNKSVAIGLEDKTTPVVEIATVSNLAAHPGGVRGLALLPNGEVVTTGADLTVKQWSLATAKATRTYSTLPGVSKAFTLSRDGAVIAIAAGKTVKLWQTADGKELPFPALPVDVSSLALSPDRQSLVVGTSDKSVTVFSIATGLPVQHFPAATNPVALAQHPNQPAVYVIEEKTVYQHAVSVVRLAKDPDFARGLTPIPNTNSLYTIGATKALARWNAGNFQKEGNLELAGPPTAIAVSKNGQLLAAVDAANTLQIYTINNGQLVGSFKAPAKVSELAFHPNGQTLAASLADKTVTVWNTLFNPGQPLPAEFGSVVQAFPHPAAVSNFAYLDESQLITGADDGVARVWKVASHQPKSIQHPNLVDCVALNKDGTQLATACHDGNVRIYDLTKPVPALLKEIKAHVAMPLPHPVYVVAWSPDGKTIASGSFDKSIKLWDAASGNLVREIKGFPEPPPAAGQPVPPGHRDQVFCLAFSKDGKQLASGSSDRTVKLWDVSNGNLVRDFPNPNLKSLGPGQPVPSHAGFVHAVRFSPDGQSLLTAGPAPRNAGILARWSLADGKLLATVDIPFGPVYALEPSADGKTVLVGCGPRVRTANEAEAYLLPRPGP